MAWSKTSSDTTTFIDSGVVPVSGTNARSVFFIFKSSHVGADYFFGWGDTSAGTTYQLRFETGGGVYRPRLEVGSGFAIANTSSVNDGNVHRIAISNAASSNVTATTFYVDGSNVGISSSSSRAINTGTGNDFALGVNVSRNIAGSVTEYAEFAVYNRDLDAAEMAMLTGGLITPRSIPRGRILYWPLVREYQDLSGLSNPTVNGSNYSITAHPRIIYPSANILQFPPTAAGGVTGAVPDSLTITDTTTNTATIVALASDSLALSDTSSVVGTFVGTVSDSIVVTDEATGDLAGAITGAVPDAMSFTDTAAVTVNFVATASDSLGLTDTSSNTANRVAASDDSLALTDLIGLTQALNVAVNDLLNLTETLTGGEVGEKVYCAYYTFMSSAETAVIAELNADDLIREAGLTDELAAYGFMSDSDTVRIAAISAADTVVAATLLC